MIKCKECGGDISSKAEACPKCGVRLKAKPSGLIFGFFKLIGGIVGAIIGLMVAITFLSSGDKRDPVQELESMCRSLSDSYSIESERPTVYSSCVSAGKAELKRHGLAAAKEATKLPISIPPEMNRPASSNKNVMALERGTLVGTLEILPMFGAKVILHSESRGDVITGKSPEDFRELGYIEDPKLKVAVSGTIENHCTPEQRRQRPNDFECLWSFDASKEIAVKAIDAAAPPPLESLESIPIPQESLADQFVPMNPRFTIERNDVLDKQTSLVWKRCPEGMKWEDKDCKGEAQFFSHSEAEIHAQKRSKAEGALWRVPTEKELLTLVDNSRQNPAMDVVTFGHNSSVSVQHTPPADYVCCQSMSVVDFSSGEKRLAYYVDGVRLRLVRNK